MQKTLKSRYTNDEISYRLKNNDSVFFNLRYVHNIEQNIRLVVKMLKTVKQDGFKYVFIQIPTNMRCSEKNKERIKKTFVPYGMDCDVMLTDNPYQVILKTNISTFKTLYKVNLHRLLDTGVVKIPNSFNIPDKDGWIEVVNKKKSKRKLKENLFEVAENLRIKYGQECQSDSEFEDNFNDSE